LERCRVIFRFGLESLPKHLAEELYREYIHHEKQYGDQRGIEDVIITKRRQQYQDTVKADPVNYDAWFDYIKMETAEGDQVCAVFIPA
jgi:crooked neck